MKYDPRHAAARIVRSLPRWAKITVPAVTVLALAGGGAAVAAGAGAATNACTSNCTDISFLSTGHHWLLNDSKGRTSDNAVVSQQLGSNGGSQGRNEDFEYTQEGSLFPTYCPEQNTPATYPGLFTAKQCLALQNANLTNADAYQLEYVPFGGEASGMCLGDWDATVPLPSASTWLSRLQPCGDAVDTILIGTQQVNGWHTSNSSAYWVISGASNNFSNPEVLGNDGIQHWENLTWQPIHINGNLGEDNQEVRATAGAY
jgi:hypothetical protein